MAQFTRKSRFSGKTRTLELPITQEQWEAHLQSRNLIQQSFPQLSGDQREFLMTGITNEEWFAGDDE
jgi:hypothetical protein